MTVGLQKLTTVTHYAIDLIMPGKDRIDYCKMCTHSNGCCGQSSLLYRRQLQEDDHTWSHMVMCGHVWSHMIAQNYMARINAVRG